MYTNLARRNALPSSLLQHALSDYLERLRVEGCCFGEVIHRHLKKYTTQCIPLVQEEPSASGCLSLYFSPLGNVNSMYCRHLTCQAICTHSVIKFDRVRLFFTLTVLAFSPAEML